MNQMLKLHLGLVKYIIQELPKKKTLKEVIEFFKQIIIGYTKEMLRFYKNLFLIFDKTYQEKKKQYEKMQKTKQDLQRCLKMLQYVDNKMAKLGATRQRRRHFWREFYSNGQIRQNVFDELLQEINQIK
jgi:methionine salvage enolase-phosphatase E1